MTNPREEPPEPSGLIPATITPATGLEKTPSSALAAQARAAIESRYLMALQQPRNWDKVRLDLIAATKRTVFAESARYRIPRGKGKYIEGPTIRFAEEALRAMGNVLIEAMAVFDDDMQRIMRVTVTDLERNLSYPIDVMVNKTVERLRQKDDRELVATRQNTNDETVYIYKATDEEITMKQNAMISKAIRNGTMRVLPSDILEETMDQCIATTRDSDKKDPDAARKRLVDVFYRYGVEPADLETFLGHDLAKTTPAELANLREIVNGMKEGAFIWSDFIVDDDLKEKTRKKAEELKKKMRADAAARAKEQGSTGNNDPPKLL